MECPTTVLSLQRIVDTTTVPAVFYLLLLLFVFVFCFSKHPSLQSILSLDILAILFTKSNDISFLVWEGFATIQRWGKHSLPARFLGVVYLWKLAPVRVWYRYDRVYMKGDFMSTDVIVTPYWIKYRRLRMRFPFQTPRRVISCWSERPYRVYRTSEWLFVPVWKSRSGTVTGVNSDRYNSLHCEILCWYHAC